MPHQFETQSKVWISKDSHHNGETLQHVTDLRSIHMADMDMASFGWTHVGEATVTVAMASADQIITSRVASLRTALTQDRANSQVRQNALLDQIQKLEAITYEPSEEPA